MSPFLVYFLLAVLLGYLLGAIPFAVIIARRFGVDILKEGSGNPGATNVKRVLAAKFGAKGKRAGNLCFLLDAIKGYIAAGWPQWFLQDQPHMMDFAVAGLLAAILGHSFSVFIGFRGGKGVATTTGGLLALTPYTIICGVCVWVFVFYLSGYVSLASVGMGLALPFLAWALAAPNIVIAVCGIVAAMILVRHRSNLQRLRRGEEHRFKRLWERFGKQS